MSRCTKKCGQMNILVHSLIFKIRDNILQNKQCYLIIICILSMKYVKRIIRKVYKVRN